MMIEPIILEGRHVRLEPLSLDHLDGLCAVGLAGDIFRWFPEPVHSAGEMRIFIEKALAAQKAGTALPFATMEKVSGRAAGSTRYGNIDLSHRRVEIGWTWLAPGWQRTPLNTEAKYLLLRRAFEQLGCIRVELKTDALNERSRKAILRIGAKEEGILRQHIITANGRFRDTVYYSIVDSEWPGVKAALEQKLARSWTRNEGEPAA
jgi:RimJ/RimL family protein N-acetyltransferase